MKNFLTAILLLVTFASFSQNFMRNDLSATDKNTLINYNSAVDGQGFIVGGNSNIADSYGYIYFYVASSTATVDGDLVLAATGMGTGRYLKCPTTPVIKRQERYTGTTNASGVYAVTYSSAFTNPIICVTPVGGTNKESQVVTSTTSGFSIKVELRSDVVGLLPTYSNVNGRKVDVIVTEQ